MQKSEVAGPRMRLGETGVLLAAVAALTLLPPQWVERLPSICINHHLFGWCPGCGSVRALVRFFHGDVAGAVWLNVNVLITAPLLALLLASGLRRTVGVRR